MAATTFTSSLCRARVVSRGDDAQVALSVPNPRRRSQRSWRHHATATSQRANMLASKTSGWIATSAPLPSGHHRQNPARYSDDSSASTICCASAINRIEILPEGQQGPGSRDGPQHTKDQWLLGSEVLQRSLITLLILCIVRCGYFALTLGLDSRALWLSSYNDFGPTSAVQQLFQASTQVPANMMIIGVYPIITASIVMAIVRAAGQLRLAGQEVFPSLAQFYRERQDNPYGVMEIEKLTNYLILFAVSVMGLLKAMELQPLALHSDFFVLKTTLMFVFTTFVLKHLAMEIDDYGMGQGLTFLISINIVTGLIENFKKATILAAKGLLPVSAQCLLLGVVLLLVVGSVIVSQVKLKFRLRYYGQNKPPDVPTEAVKARNISLEVGTLELVESEAESIYLPVLANPSGVQPLMTAGISAGILQEALAVFSPGFMQSLAWNFVGMPLSVGTLAFGFNVLDARSRGEQAAKYMSQIDCKLVGVPPGMSATRKICYIHMAAGAVGGLVIALMAVAANAFDVFFMAKYGISAGCTGVLLMTNLFVSVIRKVEEIKVKKQVSERFDKERAVIPQDMKLI